MRFKTDENLPAEAASLLRSAGYDARSVQEQAISGMPDSGLSSLREIGDATRLEA